MSRYDLEDSIAEAIFSHNDFNSNVESVIDDYDMDDKIDNALRGHDFGLSDLENKVENVESFTEDQEKKIDDLQNKYCSVLNRLESLEGDRDRITGLEIQVVAQSRLIDSLTKRIDQLESATANVDWDTLLTM